MIAGTSGGIEPLFALAYRREHALDGAPLAEVNPIFARWAAAERPDDAGALVSRVVATGRLGDVVDLPAELRERFVTATEIPAAQHLEVQAAFQRHVDNAVSKTINLPEDTPPAAIATTYRDAWRRGLKGVTVYRYGSKDRQVLTLGAGEEALARELHARCDPGACRL
jgi:ribonucleoside-diphosphate reductase alpha chain